MIGDFDMKLTHKLLGQYKRASKRMKGKILTEYCWLTRQVEILPLRGLVSR